MSLAPVPKRKPRKAPRADLTEVTVSFFAKKDTATSLKSALGAFLGFIFGTGAKLVAAGLMLFYIFVYAF